MPQYRASFTKTRVTSSAILLGLVLTFGPVATTLAQPAPYPYQANPYQNGYGPQPQQPNPYMPPADALSGEGSLNVMIILDASESMSEVLNGQSKMQMAKQVVYQTLQQLPPNVNVGLRVYGHRIAAKRGFMGIIIPSQADCTMTQTLVPIGNNTRQAIANQLTAIQPTGMTLMSYSIQQAVSNDFIGKPGKKTIVLVSDGRETCAANPCDVALAMVRSGVKVTVNTIGLGLNDPVAQDQLKCVALSTKGKFYEANTSAQLAKGLMDSFKSQANVSGRIFTGH